LLLIAVRIER